MRREWMTAVLVVGACFLGLFASQSPRSLQLGEDSGALMFQKRMLRDSDVRCAFDLSSSRQMDQVASDGVEAGPQVLDLRVVSKLSNQRLVSFQDPGGEDESLPGGGGPGGPAPTSVLVIDVNGHGDFGGECSAQSPPTGVPAIPRCSATGGSAQSPDKVSSCSVHPINGSQICSVESANPTPGQYYKCSVVTDLGGQAPPWSGVPNCSVGASTQSRNHAGFCSVYAAGGIAANDALVCSVFQTSSSNACSVSGEGTSPHKNMTCSVTGSSTPGGNVLSGCSVIVGQSLPMDPSKPVLSSCSVVNNNRRNSHCSTMSESPASGIYQLCSVQQVQDGKQGSCSVVAAATDTGTLRTCSVRSMPTGGGTAGCSVMDPSTPPPTGSTSTSTCSVIGGGAADKSYCSVFQVPVAEGGDTIRCSVFGGGGPLQPGNRRCSTYAGHTGNHDAVQPSRCSVIVPQAGGGVSVLPPGPDGMCVSPPPPPQP